jgi:ELWxxDGT repeat protein
MQRVVVEGFTFRDLRLATVDAKVLFVANDSNGTIGGLWAYDTSSDQTNLVVDLLPGGESDIKGFRASTGARYFVGYVGNSA